jgi:putative acetyltransferase
LKKVLVTLYKEMEKRKMKENIIIRLERENEYHEVENLVR